MGIIEVHSSALKHGISQKSIVYAWENFVRKRPRGDDMLVAIGFDAHGREIEMVALVLAGGCELIIHALSPATEKMRRELDIRRR